jgi:hypothetical protein
VVDQRGEALRLYSGASTLGFYWNDTRPLADAFLRTQVCFGDPGPATLRGRPFADVGLGQAMELIAAPTPRKHYPGFRVFSDNAIVNRSIENARTDIDTLC